MKCDWAIYCLRMQGLDSFTSCVLYQCYTTDYSLVLSVHVMCSVPVLYTTLQCSVKCTCYVFCTSAIHFTTV